MKSIATLSIALSLGVLGCKSSECDSCGGNLDESSMLKCPPTQVIELGDVVVNEGVVTKTLNIPGVKLHNISCSCIVVTPSADRVEIQYKPFKGMGPDSQFTRLMKQDGSCVGLIRLKARRVPPCEVLEIKPGQSWKLIVHTEKAKGAPVLTSNTGSTKIKPVSDGEWLITVDQKSNGAPTYVVEGGQVRVSFP